MDPLHDTMTRLREVRSRTPSILVAYSGGKDSLCVMDLCCRVFDRVQAFYMYVVPDLRSDAERLAYCEAQWGVRPFQIPHPVLIEAFRYGLYRPESWQWEALPDYSMTVAYDSALALSGESVLATGAKKADSLWRRKQLASWGSKSDTVYPLLEWNLHHVAAYLKTRNLRRPQDSGLSIKGATGSGLSFAHVELLHLHDYYPEDFQTLCRYFPYAEAVVHRRTWYGLTK